MPSSKAINCWLDGTYGITLALPRECVQDLAGAGDVEDAARYWSAVPEISAQLDAIGHDMLVRALRECGAWTNEELADVDMTRIRALWVASGCPDEND